jgi:hypothetical protein
VRKKAALAGGAGAPAERGRIGSAERRTKAAGTAEVFANGTEFELDASPASIRILGWGAEGTSEEEEESFCWPLMAAAGTSKTAFGVSTI